MEINLLQPPTDNLYKFMAILGLMLWIGGVLYPWTKAYELEKEIIFLEAQVSQSKENSSNSNPIELDKNVKLIRLNFKATVIYFSIGILSMLAGGFLMIYGFKLWYLRVQKPLDNQLRKMKPS
jgi:hypothetical protein